MNKESNESKAIKQIIYSFKALGAKIGTLKFNGDNMLVINDPGLYMMVITTCTTGNDTYCIKIEDFVVKENQRGNGVGTRIFQFIKLICNKYEITVGFWVRKEDINLHKWYKKLGFKHTDTRKDYWFEYKGVNRYGK